MILTENSDGSCHGMFSVFCHYFNLSEWVEMLQAQDDSENKIRSQVITKAAATALQITTDGNSISIWTCIAKLSVWESSQALFFLNPLMPDSQRTTYHIRDSRILFKPMRSCRIDCIFLHYLVLFTLSDCSHL